MNEAFDAVQWGVASAADELAAAGPGIWGRTFDVTVYDDGRGETLDHERRIGCRAVRNRRHPRWQASALPRNTGFETTHHMALLTQCRHC